MAPRIERVYRRIRARAARMRRAPSGSADRRPASGSADRRASRDALLARLPKGGTCAEVGTWKGDFAARILARVEPERLYLIDPWEYRGESEYEHSMYGGDSPEGQREMDEIYNAVLARFDAEIARGQVVVMRMRSTDAATQLGEDSLDWAYIDSDHTYESVHADLESFSRAVKPGGLIAGDDYGESGWWGNGVTRAVDEFTAAGRCGVPAIVGSQFLFTKS